MFLHSAAALRLPHTTASFGIKHRALLSASAAALLVAGPAFAQIPQAADASAVEEVVVTGTRIVRDGYEAPTPLTVVGREQLQSSATQNVADYVNTMPVFTGSITPSTSQATVSNGQSGINALNLRNLGANRTLVLLDGQRSVGINSSQLVDVNLMPQGLISRVDVVTGGASAAYGSDALAGVVNFVLDKTFTGVKGEVGGGVTTYGDDRQWDVNLTGGTAFGNGRGHFLINGGVSYIQGIPRITRSWQQTGYSYMTNPAYGTPTAANPGLSTSVPQMLLLNHVSPDNGFANFSVITSGPLKGTMFGPGGSVSQFHYGDLTFDPDTHNSPDFAATQCRGTKCDGSLASQEATQNAFMRLSYDVTDDINVYVQAAWAHNHNSNDCCSMESNASITELSGNPFIPASVQAQMTALKITSVLMGSQYEDLPNIVAVNDRRTNRYVVGANGKLDAFESTWTWNAYYQKGVSLQSTGANDAVKRTALAYAIDAVTAPNGAIVCRITLTRPSEGCVPFNMFGVGVNSQAAINYVEGSGARDFRHEHFGQDVMAASIQGEPFSSWAGPVSVATGIEHRVEKVSGIADPDSFISNWYFGNYKVFPAGYNVTEGFVETVVPLAKDTVWAKSLDFNGAIRATGYSTSGYVTTWKVGATWAPIDDMRFRATRSRDIRAPNLAELYNAGGGSAPAVRNPFRGNASETITGNTIGNPNLQPEKSDTTGFGVVLQPTFIPGFSASVDYWNLNIAGAIGSLSVQQIIDNCYAGNTQLCNAVSFVPDGSHMITAIANQPFNLITQIARGIDFEASYRIGLSSVVSSWAGDLGLRFLATNYIKNYSSNGINLPTDTAGQNFGNGPPSWRWTASATYALDPVNLNFSARGVSAGTYSNSYIVCSTACPVSTTTLTTASGNSIAGQVFFDTSISYKFMHANAGGDAEVFLNVKNLFNSDPAPVPGEGGGFSYAHNLGNPALYDVYGRVFRAGVRFKM